MAVGDHARRQEGSVPGLGAIVRRSDGRGVATLVAVSVAAALAWLAPLGGGVTAATLTTDALPLVVADGPAAPVVGSLHAGTTRVYVTLPSLLAVLAGELVVTRLDRWRLPAAAALGAVGASGLLVLSSCGCGTGSAQYLVEAAARAP